MGMRNLEASILAELRVVAKKRSIRQKDIVEWSTSQEQVKKNLVEGEKYFYLPGLQIAVAVKMP